ncbi:MAG TPA: hypothetical protein VF092_23630 [Longimicrobium sp.]
MRHVQNSRPRYPASPVRPSASRPSPDAYSEDAAFDRLVGVGIGGAMLGASLGGPVGAVVGALVGLVVGGAVNNAEREKAIHRRH